MIKTLLIALALVSLPAAVFADTSSSTMQSSNSAASMLGPSSLTSGSGNGNGTNSGTSLQPANNVPLQSSDSGSSGSSSAASVLQAPSSSSQSLQVLSANAAGGPQSLSSGTDWLMWLWIILPLMVISAASAALLRSRPDADALDFAVAGRDPLDATELDATEAETEDESQDDDLASDSVNEDSNLPEAEAESAAGPKLELPVDDTMDAAGVEGPSEENKPVSQPDHDKPKDHAGHSRKHKRRHSR